MKVKRLVVLLLAISFVFSLCTSVFAANTGDTAESLYWRDADRYDATPFRTKQDTSRVYFRIANYSLPVGGVDFQTQISRADGTYIYSPYHLVSRNSSYAINHTAGDLAKNQPVRLGSYYPASRYSWGEVHIYWSPDYRHNGSNLLG